MQKYIYEQDPGHGWLGVPEIEVKQLGIAEAISSCSYWDRSRALVWLEEDCDMSVFLMAKLADEFTEANLNRAADATDRETRQRVVGNFFDLRVIERHVERTSIRNMPSYGERQQRWIEVNNVKPRAQA